MYPKEMNNGNALQRSKVKYERARANQCELSAETVGDED